MEYIVELEYKVQLENCCPKQMSLLGCKVIFDQEFLRWPNKTFYTSDRSVNTLTCSAHASNLVKSLNIRDL